MDDFNHDVIELYIYTKHSSVARTAIKLLKENNQHERIMKIVNMTHYCLDYKIRKQENILEKYKIKKGRRANLDFIEVMQINIKQIKKAKEILDDDLEYLENKEKKKIKKIKKNNVINR
jgi:hypothetical protein